MLRGVSIDVRAGETVGLVAESGSGKTTLGRAILGLAPVTGGEVHFQGRVISGLDKRARRALSKDIQVVFQDPYSSLNPARTIGQTLVEPLRLMGLKGAAALQKARAGLESVGLPGDAVDRYPSQFSGGQRQRIAIARALVCDPKVVVLDEPVSALDLSTQAQVLNLLADLRDLRGLAFMFIAHDLGVVRNISDRVAVMYLGRICELGETRALFDHPAHPYTRLLVSSIPSMETVSGADIEEADRGRGAMPSPINPPSGCRFRTRCPLATERCATEVPEMREVKPGRFAACHHPILEPGHALPVAEGA